MKVKQNKEVSVYSTTFFGTGDDGKLNSYWVSVHAKAAKEFKLEHRAFDDELTERINKVFTLDYIEEFVGTKDLDIQIHLPFGSKDYAQVMLAVTVALFGACKFSTAYKSRFNLYLMTGLCETGKLVQVGDRLVEAICQSKPPKIGIAHELDTVIEHYPELVFKQAKTLDDVLDVYFGDK